MGVRSCPVAQMVDGGLRSRIRGERWFSAHDLTADPLISYFANHHNAAIAAELCIQGAR